MKKKNKLTGEALRIYNCHKGFLQACRNEKTDEKHEYAFVLTAPNNSRLSCGAGWIFSAKKRAEVENLINGGEVPVKAKANEALKDMAVYVGTYHKYNCGSIAGDA